MKTGKGFIFKILPALVLAVLMQSVFISAALAADPAIQVEEAGTDIIATPTIDFENVAAGGSASKTITIKNAGITNVNLVLSGGTPYVSLDSGAPFFITQPSSPVTFGSSTSFTVTFEPTLVNFYTNALYINSNDANGNGALAFTLMGSGIDPTVPTTQATIGTLTPGVTTATLNWSRGNGANCIVVMKASASTLTAPSDSTTYTADAAFGSGTPEIGTGNYVVYNGIAATVSVTGLTASTTYDVYVYEYNGAGGSEVYKTPGATGSFTTTTGTPSTPTVSGINPTSGTTAGGTPVTITGTNFLTGLTSVTIGGAACTGVAVGSTTSLTCTTPAGTAGAQNVVVTVTGAASTGTLPGGFTYIAPPPITASVVLNSVSNITGSTALATATATGADIGERGFYWWIPPTAENHFGGSESGLLPEGYGAGNFSLTVTGLKPGNTYRLKAYVKVGGQTITSDEQLFTTPTTGATGKTSPTVLTDTKNFTVSGNSITVSGEITDVGTSPVNVYGFVYAKHTAPFIGDNMPATGDTAFAMWEQTPLYQGLKFTGTVKNIPPGNWYLRTYAHNANPDSDAAQTASLSYGEEISFSVACTPETCIPGDVNGDGKVDLNDAMLVLRILDGIPVGNINLNADVNGDGKIGLEELGYILQKVAELRPSGA